MTPGTTTIPFLVNAGNSANATQWQSSTAGSGAFYEALSGAAGTASGTGGAGGGSTTTVGTPTITYTPTNHTGGNGGGGGGSNSLGGGGGGGAGGPNANGGGGGTPTLTGGGGGGGGGAANAGGNSGSSSGGTGGNGSSGSGGATDSNGTGSSGGGGGTGGAASTAGIGGSGTDFQTSPAFGCGGGGGGSGGKTTAGTVNLTGGNGGSFGGGGGGVGCLRTSGGTLTVGAGAPGLIAIFYISAFAWPAPESYYTQAQQAVRSKRAAGFMTGHVGSEQPLLNLRPFTEVQPPQPPSRMPARASKYAGFAVGDAGNENPFVGAAVTFVDRVASEYRAARAPRMAEAIEGTSEFLADNLQPWHETVSLPPPHKPRVNAAGGIMQRVGFLASSLAPWYEVKFEMWRSPPRRQSMIGDDGIENPFAVPSSKWGFDALPSDLRRAIRRLPAIGDDGIEGTLNLVPWGYDLQPLTARAKMRRDPQKGDDGNEAPFVFYVNSGWEIAPAITYNAKRQKSAAMARGNDGDEGGLISIGNFGFEVQPTLHPHRRFKNLDDGDRGIENVFLVASTAWGYEAVLSFPRPPVRKGDAIDFAVEFLASNLTPVTWEINLPPPYRVPRNQGAAIRQRIGFGTTSQVTTPWGYEQMPDVRPARLNRLSAAKGRADFGIFASFVPYAYDQAWQPPRRRWESWAALIGRNEFAWFTYVPWQEVNAEALRPRPRRLGALTRGDDPLSPAAAIVFNPQFDQQFHARLRWKPVPQTWAWNVEPGLLNLRIFTEVQPTQPVHPRPERSGAIARGDDGIESTYGVVSFVPQFDQPFHARLRPKPVPQQWAWNVDTSLLNLAVFTEVQSVQPPRRPWERRGAFLRGDDGIEGTEPAVVPPFGWFVQPWQPPRRRWERWAGIAPRDDQAQFPLLNLRVFTEVQPPQPPHRPPPKVGSFLRGDDQAYYPLINLRPMGWEVQPPQPPHWPRTRQAGLILKGDAGIDAPFVRFIPMGWEFNFPTLLHRWWHDPETGDPGDLDLYRPGAQPQWGFEWPYPPLLVRRWHRGNIFQGFDSSIFPYDVIGPDWCLAMDSPVFSCAASDIAVPTLASDIGTGIVVGDI